jgi:hypothetical protein
MKKKQCQYIDTCRKLERVHDALALAVNLLDHPEIQDAKVKAYDTGIDVDDLVALVHTARRVCIDLWNAVGYGHAPVAPVDYKSYLCTALAAKHLGETFDADFVVRRVLDGYVPEQTREIRREEVADA